MIVIVGCSIDKSTDIFEWLDELRELFITDNPIPPKLRRLLKELLHDFVVIANTSDLKAAKRWVGRHSKKGEKSFYIICCKDSLKACDTGDKRTALRGRTYRRKREIYLCKRGQNKATLFHELVHLAGGTELDSEAYENTVFGWFSHANEPTPDDFDKFVDESCNWRGLRVTDFTIWDPESGDKWSNTGTRARPRKGRELSSNPSTPHKVLKKLKDDKGKECGKKKKSAKKGAKETGKKTTKKGSK